jgi:hypothetical protein
MTEIKFDSLASLDFSRFARATPLDYPAGRYSATITGVVPQTKDSKDKPCFRFQVQIAVDAHEGKPQLRLTDLVSFTGPNGFMWAGANVFCDIAALAGLDRDQVYSACKDLANALESANITACRDAYLALAEIARVFPGTRVAPNIVWTDDSRYANVKGSKAIPSYVSASNEQDPASSFTGDDCDMERQPTKPARKLKAVRR